MEYDASPFQENLQHHVKKVRIFRFFIEFLSFTIRNRIHVFGPFSLDPALGALGHFFRYFSLFFCSVIQTETPLRLSENDEREKQTRRAISASEGMIRGLFFCSGAKRLGKGEKISTKNLSVWLFSKRLIIQ